MHAKNYSSCFCCNDNSVKTFHLLFKTHPRSSLEKECGQVCKLKINEYIISSKSFPPIFSVQLRRAPDGHVQHGRHHPGVRRASFSWGNDAREREFNFFFSEKRKPQSFPTFSNIFPPLQHGIQPWHTIFYITAALLIAEFIVFTLFASGVEQEWNRLEIFFFEFIYMGT